MTPKEVMIIDLLAESDGRAGERADGAVYCKFVVIDDAVARHVVFGPVSQYAYHANLVDAFCTRMRLACGWVKRPDIAEVYDPSVDIRGGGMMDVRRSSQSLRVFGASKAYGAFRRRDIESAIRTADSFSGYQIDFPDQG
jgi:hypothetical protein